MDNNIIIKQRLKDLIKGKQHISSGTRSLKLKNKE